MVLARSVGYMLIFGQCLLEFGDYLEEAPNIDYFWGYFWIANRKLTSTEKIGGKSIEKS